MSSGTRMPTSTGPRTTSSMRRGGCATSTSAKANTTFPRRVIQALLKEAGANVGGIVSRPARRSKHRRPRRTSGTTGPEGFASAVPQCRRARRYNLPGQPANGEWNLHGNLDHYAAVRPSRSGRNAAARVRRPQRFPGRGTRDGNGQLSVFVDDKPGADTVDVKKGAWRPVKAGCTSWWGSLSRPACPAPRGEGTAAAVSPSHSDNEDSRGGTCR